MAQTAKKPEPQGEWLQISEIAKRCSIHRQVCASRLEDLGYEPDEERSNAKLKIFWFTDAMRYELKAARDELAAVRIRSLRADAEAKELKLAIARRDYVESAEMVNLMQQIVGHLYQENTIRQPKRIAPKLAKAKNVTEVKKILKADQDRIMKDLRANFERYLS